jgi:hypothetical protein
MSSNRVVSYIDIGLATVEEYWDALLLPDVKAFLSEPDRRSLFNAAATVWHLHDWVWHDRNHGQNSRGPAFDAFRTDLLHACPELGWLRDVADASKHHGIGRVPAVEGASPQIVGTPIGLTIVLTREVVRFFLALNDGSKHDVDQVLRTAVAYWRTDLSAKNLSSPF